MKQPDDTKNMALGEIRGHHCVAVKLDCEYFCDVDMPSRSARLALEDNQARKWRKLIKDLHERTKT